MSRWVTAPSPQAVGIPVTFVSHLTCAFTHSTQPSLVAQATEATINTGSKVAMRQEATAT